jgi:3-hydroxyanthranilate 3,4-dioxygenase
MEGGESAMVQMPIANLLEVARELLETGKQVNVLWQEEEALAFEAKGRDYRSECHTKPMQPKPG